jgi:hypothetical protein
MQQTNNNKELNYRMRETGNEYNILVGKPEGKRPLGALKCRCEDNIGMDLNEIGWEGVGWIYLAQNGGR